MTSSGVVTCYLLLLLPLTYIPENSCQKFVCDFWQPAVSWLITTDCNSEMVKHRYEVSSKKLEILSAIFTYAALYLWFVQFLQSKETSTGELCENLLTVCHELKTWMHRQPVFTVVTSEKKHSTGHHSSPQSLHITSLRLCINLVTTLPACLFWILYQLIPSCSSPFDSSIKNLKIKNTMWQNSWLFVS